MKVLEAVEEKFEKLCPPAAIREFLQECASSLVRQDKAHTFADYLQLKLEGVMTTIVIECIYRLETGPWDDEDPMPSTCGTMRSLVRLSETMENGQWTRDWVKSYILKTELSDVNVVFNIGRRTHE